MDKLCFEKSFLEKILKSINRLCDSCVLKIEDDQITSISSTSDNIVFLYIRGKLAEKSNFNTKINIIDIKRFLCGLDCLNSDLIDIEIHENFVKCFSKNTSEKTHFKYHLADDSVMSKSTFSIKKISQLKFDTEFLIPVSCQRQIMSAYSFSPECSKIYFKEQNDNIFVEINDLNQHNNDSVEIKVSDTYVGSCIKESIPINIEIFKHLMYTKNSNIIVKINNEYKVFVFNVKEDDSIDIKYITSALVK
jgi:hypothetical protein